MGRSANMKECVMVAGLNPHADNARGVNNTPGVNNARPGVINARKVNNARFPGVNNARKSGVINTRAGVINARTGVNNARPGVINARAGVNKARPGVINTRKYFNRHIIYYKPRQYSFYRRSRKVIESWNKEIFLLQKAT